MSGKSRNVMYPGASGVQLNVNAHNLGNGNGKWQGLPPVVGKRAGIISYINRRSLGNNRDRVYCFNQLGGVPGKAFNTSADGLPDCKEGIVIIEDGKPEEVPVPPEPCPIPTNCINLPSDPTHPNFYDEVHITASAYSGSENGKSTIPPALPGVRPVPISAPEFDFQKRGSNYRGYKPRYLGGSTTFRSFYGLPLGVSIDTWHGFLTCRELPNAPVNPNAFYFDSYWDLRKLPSTSTLTDSSYDVNSLPPQPDKYHITLKPNTSLFADAAPTNSFWINQTTGKGNKIVEQNTIVSLTATTGIVNVFGIGEIAQVTIPYNYIHSQYTSSGGQNKAVDNIKIWNKKVTFSGRVVENTLSSDYKCYYFIKKIRPNTTPSAPSYDIVKEVVKEVPKCGSFEIEMDGSNFPPIDRYTKPSINAENWPTGTLGSIYYPLNGSGNMLVTDLALPVGPSSTLLDQNYLVWCGFQIVGINADPSDAELLGHVIVTGCHNS